MKVKLLKIVRRDWIITKEGYDTNYHYCLYYKYKYKYIPFSANTDFQTVKNILLLEIRYKYFYLHFFNLRRWFRKSTKEIKRRRYLDSKKVYYNK